MPLTEQEKEKLLRVAQSATASPVDEQAFLRWYRPLAQKWGIDPNPDDPRHHYDYRAAFKAGVAPDPLTGHWPSEFKTTGHPRQFLKLNAQGQEDPGGVMVDTRNMQPVGSPAVTTGVAGPAAPSAGSVPAPYKGDFDLMGMLRNIPASAGNMAGGLANMALHPVDTIKGMGQIVAGAPEALKATGQLHGGMSVPTTLTPDEQSLADPTQAFFGAMKDRFGNLPKTAQEDPLGLAVDVASIIGPIKGGVQRTGALVGTGEVAASIPLQVIAKGLRRVGKGVENQAVKMAAVDAGTGTAAAEIALEAGRKGKKSIQATAVRKGLVAGEKGGEEAFMNLAKRIGDGVQDFDTALSASFADAAEKFAFVDHWNPIDPQSILAGVLQDLGQKYGIQGRKGKVPGRLELDFSKSTRLNGFPEEQARIQQAVDLLTDWQSGKVAPETRRYTSLPTPGQETKAIRDAHDIQKNIWKKIERKEGSRQFEDSNAIMEGIWGRIRQELGDKVQGYNEVAENYRVGRETIDAIRKALGIPEPQRATQTQGLGFLSNPSIPAIDEKTLTRVGNLLNDRTSRNTGLGKALVRDLDRYISQRTGQPGSLFEELAGIKMGRETAQGIAKVGAASAPGIISGLGGAGAAVAGALVGGAGGGTALTAGGIGLWAGSSLGTLMMNATIRNPRAMGSFLVSLGAKGTVASDAVKIMERVANATPTKLVAGGITLGSAIQRLAERSVERLTAEKMLAELGMAKPENP